MPSPTPARPFAPATAPIAERRPARRRIHGTDEPDDLGWMRDGADPALLSLLEAENAHADAVLAPVAPLVDAIEAEIRERVKEDDLSVPHRRGGWWYRSRTEKGLAYAIQERLPDIGDGSAPALGLPAEVVLDPNQLAEGHPFLGIGAFEVSPDGTRLAYAVDTSGDELYELRVRDIAAGEDLDLAIPGISGGAVWSADGSTLLYVTPDHAQRPYRLHRHRLGDDPSGAGDELLLQEDDARFRVWPGRSRSGDVIVVRVGSAVTDEILLIDAHDPSGRPRMAIPRRQGVELKVAHHGRWLYVLSNEDAPDYALWRTPLDDTARERWQPVLPHRPGRPLEGLSAFARHLVIPLRADGRPGVRVLDLTAIEDAGEGPPDPASVAAAGRDLDMPGEVYSLGGGANEEWDTSLWRFTLASPSMPATVVEEDLDSGERTVLKRMPVLGGVDPAAYESAREWAVADDGTRIPVSVVWHRDTPRDGSAPLLLYGYGAYGITMDVGFSIPRLSLLDRGIVFALAHVRGGGELGRTWHERGRMEAKPNSFSDLVAAADHLADGGWAAPDRIAIRGGSAGGLLVAAALNLAPRRFRAVIAEVPFVDALNTILDPDAPLTAGEWEEWGNPIEDPGFFRIMRGYTPTENIAGGRYPAILATAGLNDRRVSVHEPAIWVQRLRAETDADDERPVILRVQMGAGHGGPSGRYDAWRREAETLAFIVAALGVPA
ncbi:MAG: S9 family peptidase [Thermoleophilia bacterium]